MEKWGIENVNDLIVDETVADFEANHVDGTPFYNNPPTRPTSQTPNAGNDGGFHHFNGGYDYPNPNKPTASTPRNYGNNNGYLPTTGYTIHHNNNPNRQNGIDRYWQATATVIQQPPVAVSGFSYTINQR